jgi:NAD(P)-dependent dehydrogenase (short-subunit alcohol dehydrogenase family)
MHDKRLLIIGGSSGIGFEIAQQANAQGAQLTITGRDQAKLQAAAQQLGKGTKTAVLDAHNETDLERFFADLEPVDHLVSMVGDSMAGGFLDTTSETMKHVLHSKFFTNWLIGKYAAPKIQKGGSLTFTAGTGGRPHEVSATYVANAGLRALVEGLGVELAPHIRVNAVAPTFMGAGTSFWKDISEGQLEKTQKEFSKTVPLQRVATVEEVASTYMHLINNGFITGQVLAVDGGVMLLK